MRAPEHLCLLRPASTAQASGIHALWLSQVPGLNGPGLVPAKKVARVAKPEFETIRENGSLNHFWNGKVRRRCRASSEPGLHIRSQHD